MKRFAVILLPLLLASCSVTTYQHDELSADGSVRARYRVEVVNAGMSRQLDGVQVKLGDGTVATFGETSQPDPGLVQAASNFGAAVAAALLKAVGI